MLKNFRAVQASEISDYLALKNKALFKQIKCRLNTTLT